MNRFIPFLLLISLIAGLFPAQQSDARDIRSARQAEIKRLEEEIYAVRLINLLDLEEKQISLILKQSDLARPVIAAYFEELPEVFDLQRRIYAEFKAECEADQGFSIQVEKSTAQINRREKELEERLAARLNDLAEPILEILTHEQVSCLENYEPLLFPEGAGKEPYSYEENWRIEQIGEKMLEAVRLSDQAYRAQRESLARQIVNHFPPGKVGFARRVKQGKKAKKKPEKPFQEYESRDEVLERIEEVLDELRCISLEEVEARLDALIKKKIYPSKVVQLEKEMRQVHRSKHPGLTTAARFLLNQDAASYLLDSASPAPSQARAGDSDALDACLREVKELQEDITLLNLINGMHFTKKQIREILTQARKLEPDLAPLVEREDEADLDEEIRVLQSMRSDMIKKGDISSAKKSRYRELNKKKYQKKKIWKLTPKLKEKVEKSAFNVVEMLSPAQQEVLMEFKPCLIPPKNLKNPVRVGQARDSGPMKKFLEGIRDLPEIIYVNAIDEIVAEAVQGAERHVGAMPEREREEFIEKLLDAIEHVRNMSDVEFALNKETLAEELAPVDRAELIRECLAEMGVPRYQVQGKVVQFLLVPRAVPLLERRLELKRRSVH
ncbi:MAG: hypothetical protein ACYTG7_16730 [Planctomycetota bacterium]